ncbi:MAG: hypothetical protein HYX69_15765 [Planctomycetia bacterium]|nr:hypothetical protein [Planctomycetia bacterium]
MKRPQRGLKHSSFIIPHSSLVLAATLAILVLTRWRPDTLFGSTPRPVEVAPLPRRRWRAVGRTEPASLVRTGRWTERAVTLSVPAAPRWRPVVAIEVARRAVPWRRRTIQAVAIALWAMPRWRRRRTGRTIEVAPFGPARRRAVEPARRRRRTIRTIEVAPWPITGPWWRRRAISTIEVALPTVSRGRGTKAITGLAARAVESLIGRATGWSIRLRAIALAAPRRPTARPVKLALVRLARRWSVRPLEIPIP